MQATHLLHEALEVAESLGAQPVVGSALTQLAASEAAQGNLLLAQRSYRRALEVSDRQPFEEITRYLSVRRRAVDQVFATLSYFDGVNFAKRASAPAYFSVALQDLTCPPSTVYAAYNHYRGADKQINVYPYNNHEGGQDYQVAAQLDWFAELFAR